MRMRDCDELAGGVERYRTRVLAHPAAELGRRIRRQEPRIPVECDQGDTIPTRALMLHCDDDAGVSIDVEVPDRQPAKPHAERGRAHQATVGGAQHRERRDHGIQVQLRASGIGMGADPAVGDREPRARAEHPNLVRTHPVARPLPNPSPVRCGVPHPDDSAAVLEPILRRVEQRPVRTECTVPVEVPARGGDKPSLHRAVRGIENERPIAGTPGEHDDMPGRRLNRESMTASGERHVVADAA